MAHRPEGHEFGRLLAAEAVSNFGAMLSRLAIPWLAALGLDATPWQMAALLLADVAAGAAGSLLLGRWVERHGKRAVMLGCDAGRAAVLAALAFLAWQGAASMPLLVAAAAANGLLTMAFEVARSAWMAQRLAAGDLVHRNAQMSMATSLSETAAFALGGWLFQWLGAVAALALDALSYVASALCLRGVGEVRPASPVRDTAGVGDVATQGSAAGVVSSAAMDASRTAGGGAPVPMAPGWAAAARAWRREVGEGLRCIATHPTLRALASIEALMAVAGSLAGTSYMIYVARDLSIATGPLGVIFALGGLGAVVGARLAAGAARRLGTGPAMAAGLLACALGALCIPLAQGAGLLAIALLVMHQVVGDAGHTLFAVHDRTLRQTLVAPGLLARADAGIRGLGQAATLAGALAGGALGTALGARGVLWASAGVLALAAALAFARLRGHGLERRAGPQGEIGA